MSRRNRLVTVTVLLSLLFVGGLGVAQTSGTSAQGIGALAVDDGEWRGGFSLGMDRRFELTVPPDVAQGAILTAVVRVPGPGSVQGELELPDGTVHTAHGWRAAGGTSQLWILMFGVPSTAATGAAKIRVVVNPREETTSGNVIRETRILRGSTAVKARVFISETIALNSAMSNLRTEADAQKAEESRVLWELLHTTDLNARYHTGRFVSPVSSFRYSSYYGDRRVFAYSDGNTGKGLHNGVDMAAATGTPIVAAGRGRVVMATNRIVTGGTIVIEHLPAVYSLYYHMHSMTVQTGDIVETGEVIGSVGSTGLSTGPHLHWELRVSGVAVDPEQIIDDPHLDMATIRRSLLMTP